MEIVNVFSGLLVIAALFAYLNLKIIKLPSTISLMIMGLLVSLAVIGIGAISPSFENNVEEMLLRIDFSEIVLEFMLSFLLFAGAMHTDLNKLAAAKWPILTFATLGILISTFIIGTLLYYGLMLTPFHVEYIHCLLFGVLISPTDPIAVMGILKQAKLPERLSVKITGESLFNDGICVVMFILLYQIADKGLENISGGYVAELVAFEILGGLGLGLFMGWVGYRLIRSIDHYQTEVLITLALVMGGYSFATFMHFSGPLAVVVAGLMIGNKTNAMSDITLDYTNKFWEMIDEVLNAALFLLIGLEVIVITFHTEYFIYGMIAAVVSVLVRYVALYIPTMAFGFRRTFKPYTVSILTWGGLRGGISIALALSLAAKMDKEIIVAITYVVVLFSIIVQGLTIGPYIQYLRNNTDFSKEAKEEEEEEVIDAK